LGHSVPKLQARLFPKLSWKSRGKRALSKNFSVILSVCLLSNWIRRIVTSDSIGPLWHIFFSNFNKSDKWKIFRLCSSRFFVIFNKLDEWKNFLALFELFFWKCSLILLFWLICIINYINYLFKCPYSILIFLKDVGTKG